MMHHKEGKILDGHKIRQNIQWVTGKSYKIPLQPLYTTKLILNNDMWKLFGSSKFDQCKG